MVCFKHVFIYPENISFSYPSLLLVWFRRSFAFIHMKMIHLCLHNREATPTRSAIWAIDPKLIQSKLRLKMHKKSLVTDCCCLNQSEGITSNDLGQILIAIVTGTAMVNLIFQLDPYTLRLSVPPTLPIKFNHIGIYFYIIGTYFRLKKKNYYYIPAGYVLMELFKIQNKNES